MERVPLPDPPDPVDLFAQLRQHGDAFLLQSAEGPRRLARYSFLGFDPMTLLTVHEGIPHLDGEPLDAAPADAIRETLEPHRTQDDDGYAYNGGLVGYISYEYATHLEDIPPPPTPPSHPQAELGLFLDGVIYDHERRTCFYFTQRTDRSETLPLEAAHDLANDDPEPFRIGPVTTSHDESEYGQMVERVHEYIREGHTFQTVLARSFTAPTQGDPLTAYKNLLEINPSPYMFYLSYQDRDLFGASPEMLVRIEDDTIETVPIAGTRPLGDTPQQTRAYETEMLGSDKENSEHAMLVDLARNDVGRVAAPGTVNLETYKHVERYSHVQHMVSRVTAKLASGNDAIDALEALFPAGTVTGAPKIRAMQIIQELENAPRGPYAGCIGYASLNGNLDSAITIRAATHHDDEVTVRAGAGIVADSDPKHEHHETQSKGDALLAALNGDTAWT